MSFVLLDVYKDLSLLLLELKDKYLTAKMHGSPVFKMNIWISLSTFLYIRLHHFTPNTMIMKLKMLSYFFVNIKIDSIFTCKLCQSHLLLPNIHIFLEDMYSRTHLYQHASCNHSMEETCHLNLDYFSKYQIDRQCPSIDNVYSMKFNIVMSKPSWYDF